jgi:hypothetical protein
MRQVADGNRRNLLEGVCLKDLHLIKSTDCDIGKLSTRSVDEVNVIGDRPSFDDA